MPNGDGSKKDRKNMNLSLRVFKSLEAERRLMQKSTGISKMPWDVFFEMLLKEARRQPDPETSESEAPRRKAIGR